MQEIRPAYVENCRPGREHCQQQCSRQRCIGRPLRGSAASAASVGHAGNAGSACSACSAALRPLASALEARQRLQRSAASPGVTPQVMKNTDRRQGPRNCFPALGCCSSSQSLCEHGFCTFSQCLICSYMFFMFLSFFCRGPIRNTMKNMKERRPGDVERAGLGASLASPVSAGSAGSTGSVCGAGSAASPASAARLPLLPMLPTLSALPAVPAVPALHPLASLNRG